MHLALEEAPALQSTQDPAAAGGSAVLMTPARRAALDALEREFHELLVRDVLKSATR